MQRIGSIVIVLLVWLGSAHSVYAAVFENPLQVNAVGQIVENIVKWLLGIVGVLALLALIIGGMRMIFGGFGNEQEAQKAKQIIFWAVAGLSVVIISWIIVGYVAQLLGA